MTVTEDTPLVPRINGTAYGANGDDNNGDDLHVSFDPAIPPDDDDEDFQPIRHRRNSSFAETVFEQFEEVVEKLEDTIEEVKEVIEETIEEVKEVFEEEIVPVKPREEGEHDRRLSAVTLAVLVFYKVSGGPFGCEPSVKAAGPLFALLGFILFPFCWCCQEALVTAELGSAFPEPSVSIRRT